MKSRASRVTVSRVSDKSKNDGIKPDPALSELRDSIAGNLADWMEQTVDPELQSEHGIERRTGVSYKTVRRMLKPELTESPPTIRQLHHVALAFNKPVWQLLVPLEARRRRPMVVGNEARTTEKTKQIRLAKHETKR